MAQKRAQGLLAAIRAKGYDWAVDEAQPLARLSVKEQRSYLGLSVTEEEMKATAAAIKAQTALAAFKAITAPPAIDWRNNGGNWTTPVKDQRSCGSCVSFGTCATIEARIKIACKNASMTPDLSEAHLFYCGCGNCCNNGWNFPPALDYCKNTGVAVESAFPYTPVNQPCKAGLTPYIKLTGLVGRPRRRRPQERAGGERADGGRHGRLPGLLRLPHGRLPARQRQPGRLPRICVVGYDDAQQCWICKNSWDTTWGDDGWFRIGYGECGIDTSFAFYDVSLACPVVDDCRKYLPYLTRVLQAARTNPGLRACLRYYVCRRLPRPILQPSVSQRGPRRAGHPQQVPEVPARVLQGPGVACR